MDPNDAALDAAFDAAFDEAVTGTPGSTPASGDEGINDGTPPAGDEGTPPAGDDGTPPAGDDGTPPAGDEPPAVPVTPPAPAGPTEAERIAALEAQLAEANAKLAAPPAAPPAAPAAPAVPSAPAAPAAPEPAKLTAEEQEELDEFTSNWPAHSKALALQNKLLQKQMEQMIATGIQGAVTKINEQLAPVIQSVQKTEHKSFRQAVMESHADLDTVLPQVQKWIESQPAYLRPAYENTMRSAPVEDVVDLLTRAKKELGIDVRPTPDPATPPATPPAIDPAKQGRLDRMESVDGGSSRPTRSGADPLDFDGAFDEAANRLTK